LLWIIKQCTSMLSSYPTIQRQERHNVKCTKLGWISHHQHM
jgi:hypothetical protein